MFVLTNFMHVEVLLLAVPLWPLLRLLATPGFRRRLRALPDAVAALAAGLVVYAGGIAVVALYLPALLLPLALLAAGLVAAERWRARSAYGRARGLPPGSLALLPRAPLHDPLFYMKQAQLHGPIFKTSQFLRPTVCVVGLPRAIELLSRHDAILQPSPIPFDRLIPGSAVRYKTPEEHAAFIPFFRAAFTHDVINACEPDVAACVRQELGRMAADSAAASEGMSPRPYLGRITRVGFARIFFGFTPETPPLARFLALLPYISFRNLTRSRRRRSQRALEEISQLIRAEAGRVAAATKAGGSAAPSFLRALFCAYPEAVQDPSVVCNLAYSMEDSAGDVAGLLDWLLRRLTDHPRWLEALRAEVARAGTPPDGLANRIVLETLRLGQMEFLYRNVTQDLPLDGFIIPTGWLLRICVRESHNDPAVFPDPDSFDPDRFLERSYSRAQYAPFGNLGSRLVCLGEQLTRMVGRIFVSELAAGFDWRVVQDGPPEFSGWHWAPSGRLRLQLKPRA